MDNARNASKLLAHSYPSSGLVSHRRLLQFAIAMSFELTVVHLQSKQGEGRGETRPDE